MGIILNKILYLVLLTICCGIIMLHYFLKLYFEDYENKTQIILYNEADIKTNNTKFILLWNKCYGTNYWYHAERNFYDESTLRGMNCPESRCFITHRRDYRYYYNFDALLFHMIPDSTMGIPRFRHENQLYIYGGKEPAGIRARGVKNLNNFYNLTG
jgi:hypothetical protein